jgi:DNA gyrase subunit B
VDDGRGIPVDMHTGENISALEVVMTRLHAGGKFDKDSLQSLRWSPRRRRISVVNALSEWCEVSVYPKQHDLPPALPAREYLTLPSKRSGPTELSGTEVSFRPDEEIFETVTFSFDTLSHRLENSRF